MSHTISTIFTALFCFIYVLYNLKSLLKKDVIIKCIVNIIFIILISSFFIIPILEFEGQSHYAIFDTQKMRTNGEWVDRNTVEPWQFIKDKIEENPVSFVVGIPSIVLLIISALAYGYIDKEYKSFYVVNLILGIICLYMCTQYFPWRVMPQILTNIQYPWRLEGFAFFFFTPVMAMNVVYLLQCIKKKKMQNIIYIIVIVILGVFTILELSVYKTSNLKINEGQSNLNMNDEKYENKTKDNPIISHFSVNREYMPYKAIVEQSGYVKTREDKVYVLQGEAEIKNEEKHAFDLKFDISQVKKETVLELPYLFYPGYTVNLFSEGKNQKLYVLESQKGFLQIALPEDIQEGQITVKYTGTLIEKWGYAISFVSFILFIEYIIYSKKRGYQTLK